jgi:hypothetical protein
MEDLYEDNVKVWSRLYPKEAVLLSYIDSDAIRATFTVLEEENLSICVDGNEEHFHSPQGAMLEADNVLSAVTHGEEELLYIYGVGAGYFFESALPWLEENPKRLLVFIEDDLRVLKLFFHMPRAKQLLQHSQVSLLYMPAGMTLKDSLGAHCWNYFFHTYRFLALPLYEKIKKQAFDDLRHAIGFESSLTKQLLQELLNGGVAYYHNAYQNYLHVHESYLGDALFGKFSGIPAIICGAGPSLEKNRSLLHDLQQRALIFSGGSATNALSSIGVQPHFCVGLDPNEAQIQRLSSNLAFEIPFFYRSRLNHEAFLKTHAPRLYLTGGGGYEIADYFEQQLGIEGQPFEEGRNVITFALEIAHLMGCSPILFVGLDLAYTSDKLYSRGVATAADETPEPADERLWRQDIFGKPVQTEWKWTAEAEWIGDWAKEHPEALLLNCTEGGIGIPGVPNESLETAAQAHLQKEWDLTAAVHVAMQSAALPEVTAARVIKVMHGLKASFDRSLEHINVLIEDMLKAKAICENDHHRPQQSGMAALAEIELADEAAYTYALAMFNIMYAQFLNKDLLHIRQSIESLTNWQRESKEIDISIKKLRFLSQVAMANIELINHALRAKEKPAVEAEIMPLPMLELPQKNIPFNPLSTATDETIYYPHGGLKSVAHFKDGILHGESIYYSPEGGIISKCIFEHGRRQGEFLLYYPSGTLYSKQHYIDGLKDGPQLYFYADGTLKTSINYSHGTMIGDICLYSNSGKLTRLIHLSALYNSQT